MDFKVNLRNIRNDAGFTQKALGEKIGVTSITIGNWERGVRQPSFDLLPKLADALGTSVDALFGKCETLGFTKLELDEEELLRRYRKLDAHGKKLLRIVCDAELDRIKPDKRTIVSFDDKMVRQKHNRYIPRYLTPSAAGTAVPLEGNEFEMLLADDSVPRDADYAVCISGDSMEPYIHNGDMVFVKETQDLNDGDVGIFCVDGAMYCKQYHLDENKNLHLLSANAERIDANVYVDKDSGLSVQCRGKVILDHTIPLPSYLYENKD